jgi:hypothetical protein
MWQIILAGNLRSKSKEKMIIFALSNLYTLLYTSTMVDSTEYNRLVILIAFNWNGNFLLLLRFVLWAKFWEIIAQLVDIVDTVNLTVV